MIQLALKIALGLGLPFFLGWIVAQWRLNTGRALGVLGVLVLLLMELALASTGSFHPEFGEVHRWLGHAMVIVAWWVTPFCAAVFTCMWRVHRFIFALICEYALLLLTVGLLLHTSFTGYLYVEPIDPLSTETYHRFMVIHGIVEPALLFVFLSAWLGTIWPRARSAAITSSD